MMPLARLVHSSQGRTRFRVPERVRDSSFFAEAGAKLIRFPAIDHIEANPKTGSILLLHHGNVEEIEKFARDEGLFEVQSENDGLDRIGLAAGQQGFDSPREFSAKFDEQLGVNKSVATLSAVVLLGLAALQVRNGRILPPAYTLATQALGALALSRR
jgi:hypothetical protein